VRAALVFLGLAFSRRCALLTVTLLSLGAFFQDVCHAEKTKSAAGLEIGGSGTALFSDPSLRAFGLGAGYQGSIFYSMWTDRPIGGKVRFETVSLNQTAIQKTSMDYLRSGSSLKSMSQQWTLFSAGAEGHFESQGQQFFWEAMLGYAFGGSGKVTVTQAIEDRPLIETDQSTSSAFALCGGIGIKRRFSQRVIGLMTLRSFILLSSPYSSEPMANKSFFLFPILFNVGVEFPFEF
jgi:hypothetical protein